MFRTVTLGSCVSVQGEFVKQLHNGNLLIRVGEKLFEGSPAAQDKSESVVSAELANA